MMDPLQIKTDEPLEVPNIVHPSYDLDVPLSSSCSTSKVLVGANSLKEEEIADPLLIKYDEPAEVANYSQSSYGLDTPKSSSCNSSQALVGSVALKEEESVDPLQVKNDEPMKFSNFSHSSYGLDNPKSSSCILYQALVGSFTYKEEGSFRNVRSRKKRSGLFKDISSTGETTCLTIVSSRSKLREKIYLKTTVEIEKLTKRTIEENCCGKWRCSACGKIENSFYFLQLHKSTNCETGLSFICDTCGKEINSYSEFAIHYIEHEANKKKKCPICLCPNVNDIKEHLILTKHLSEDITGFKFTDNEFKRSNEKAKPEVFFNSTIDGYCQDTTADMLTNVKTDNMDISSASVALDTVKLSPIFNQLMLNSQKQEEQGKTDIGRSKQYRIDDISDEGEKMADPMHISNMDSNESSISNKDHHFNQGQNFHYPYGFTTYTVPTTHQNFTNSNHYANNFTNPFQPSQHRDNQLGVAFDLSSNRNDFIQQAQQTISSFSPRQQPVSFDLTMKQGFIYGEKSIPNFNNQQQQNQDFNGLVTQSLDSNVNFEIPINHQQIDHSATFGHKSTIQKPPKKKKSFDEKAAEAVTKNSPPLKKQNVLENLKIAFQASSSSLNPSSVDTGPKGGKSKDIFPCPHCEKSYSHKPSLRKHIAAIHDQMKYPCPTCGLVFTHKTGVRQHVNAVHLKEVSFTCDICGKNFFRKALLKLHQRVHSGEKPYLCQECGKSFPMNSSFKRHMRFHNGTKAYDCKLCGRTFNEKYNLKAHLLRAHKMELDEETGSSLLPDKTLIKSNDHRIVMFLKANSEKSVSVDESFRDLPSQNKFSHENSTSQLLTNGVCTEVTEAVQCLLTGPEEDNKGFHNGFKVDSLSKTNEKKAKKAHLSIVQSTPDVQEKPNLRQRKKNTIYVESSDSDIADTTDEEMDKYSEESHEEMIGKMLPKSYISHIKPINRASGNGPSQSKEVTLESFGSLWGKDVSLRFKKKSSIESSENTHICKICSESFALRISLSNHMKGHDEIEIQQCQFYRSKFKKTRNLDRRFETQSGTRGSSYECTICKKTYNICGSFKNHMRWHRQLLRATALNDKSASDPMFTDDRSLTYDNLNKCATCGSTYKYRQGLLRHLRCNPEHRETHFCNIHNKSFSPDLLFQSQTEISKSDNKNEMLQCPFCQIKFKKEHHLCSHLFAHREGTCNLCIRCNMCTSSFSLPVELLNHLKMHKKTEASEETEIISALQPSENSDSESASKSEPVTNNIVRENDFNECGICKKTYVKRKSLLRHLRMHATGRKYLCNICGLSFYRDNVLKIHMQRHTGDKNFTCNKCGNSFYCMSDLNRHLKKHATEESGQRPEKLFQCEICNTKLLTKQIYSIHMKRHTEGTAHECGICRRKCYSKYQLTEHLRIHTGEKPYECKICNHSFAQIRGLRCHMKHHSDKKFSCEFCSKKFMNKDKKDDHVNIHTGNKPYKCTMCDLRFGSRAILKNHMRKVHMRNPKEKKFREKKYSCNICNEKFAVSAYRDQHVALHANPNPFSCEFCSKSFNYKKNMVAHVQRVHPSCNPFRCKLCSKTYDTIRKIDVHVNSRACVKNDMSHKKSKNQDKSIDVDVNTNAENLFICNICNEESESVEKIEDHFSSSHKPSK